jgi:hypothetical protein
MSPNHKKQPADKGIFSSADSPWPIWWHFCTATTTHEVGPEVRFELPTEVTGNPKMQTISSENVKVWLTAMMFFLRGKNHRIIMVQRIQLDCCEYPILGNSLISASITIAVSRVFSITIAVFAHFSVCVFYDLVFLFNLVHRFVSRFGHCRVWRWRCVLFYFVHGSCMFELLCVVCMRNTCNTLVTQIYVYIYIALI